MFLRLGRLTRGATSRALPLHRRTSFGRYRPLLPLPPCSPCPPSALTGNETYLADRERAYGPVPNRPMPMTPPSLLRRCRTPTPALTRGRSRSRRRVRLLRLPRPLLSDRSACPALLAPSTGSLAAACWARVGPHEAPQPCRVVAAPTHRSRPPGGERGQRTARGGLSDDSPPSPAGCSFMLFSDSDCRYSTTGSRRW
ncbi:hypothetical protein LZ30DRAFT_738411 [Colletotrichum cereale]|nr:hypothetical protein LZ30DRAFT_738411 [Colletotrichum cereale]